VKLNKPYLLDIKISPKEGLKILSNPTKTFPGFNIDFCFSFKKHSLKIKSYRNNNNYFIKKSSEILKFWIFSVPHIHDDETTFLMVLFTFILYYPINIFERKLISGNIINTRFIQVRCLQEINYHNSRDRKSELWL